MVSLSATPTSALVDEDVTITMSGLHPYQHVTMVAILHEEKIKMFSHAFYVADGEGRVDVTTMPSVGGFYTGVEPMGFLWSMKPGPSEQPGTRLLKRNVLTPMIVHLNLYSGHRDVQDPENISSDCLASARLERWYLSKDVERVEIKCGKMLATMFIPKAAGLYPGVLDLYGTAGGILEYRAALLASRGFATMSLSYFSHKTGMISTQLEYFEEAIDILLDHPKVIKGGIGVVGMSKGAELANLLSIVIHKIRAVVAIGGPAFLESYSWTYKGRVFEAVKLDIKPTETDEGITHIYDEETFLDPYMDKIIPLQESHAKHLLVFGDDDITAPSVAGRELKRRMVEAGRTNDCEVLVYHGAGHLIEPPHSPTCRVSFHKLWNSLVIWGGWPKPHADAQVHLWQHMQNFLRTTLTAHQKPQQSNL